MNTSVYFLWVVAALFVPRVLGDSNAQSCVDEVCAAAGTSMFQRAAKLDKIFSPSEDLSGKATGLKDYGGEGKKGNGTTRDLLRARATAGKVQDGRGSANLLRYIGVDEAGEEQAAVRVRPNLSHLADHASHLAHSLKEISGEFFRQIMRNQLIHKGHAGADFLPPRFRVALVWCFWIVFIITALLVVYASGFAAMLKPEPLLEHGAGHDNKHEHEHGHGECHGHGHDECHQHAHSHRCNSTMHRPGACHGFEASMDATWKVTHGNFSLADSLNPHGAAARKRREGIVGLGGAVATSVVVMVLELSCGYIFGSLALLSDGVHQLSDVALYGGLLLTLWLSGMEGHSVAYSFGYDRVQVVGGLTALLLQYFATGLLVTKASDRLASARPQNIDGRIICLVSLFTVITSLVLVRVLPNHGHGHNHGAASKTDASAVGVARLHVLADLVQGFICTCVGILIWWRPQYSWADSLSTFAYAAVVVISSYGILRDLIHILLERAHPELDAQIMFGDLARIKGVIDVHCCHAWLLAPEKISVSAHMHIEDDRHEEVLHAAQIILRHKYGIIHSTLQVSEDEDLA